jgi:hypothetical protein
MRAGPMQAERERGCGPMRAETETTRACRAMPMRAGPREGREREGMWADAGRDRDHAGLPGDVDCRSLGFLPACRAQAQALLLIIRVLDALFLVSAARPTHSAHGAVEGLKMRCGFVAAPRAERWRA